MSDKKTTEPPEATEAEDYRVLFPGRIIPLEDPPGEAVVYPVGVMHLAAFSNEIARLLGVVANINLKGTKEEIGRQVALSLAPHVLGHSLGLLRECVIIRSKVGVTFDQLPHWVLPMIAEAWIEESFGEEKKWRPWLKVLDQIVSRVTGGEFSSISEMLSSSSQEEATPPST